MFHKVWRAVVGQKVGRKPASGLMQSCLHSHYPSSKMFTPRFLRTKATLIRSSWDLVIIERLSQRRSKDVRFCWLHCHLKLRALPYAVDLCLTQLIAVLHTYSGMSRIRSQRTDHKLECAVHISHTQVSKVPFPIFPICT